MNTRTRQFKLTWLLAAALAWSGASIAQVPVDEDGKPVGQFETGTVTASEDLPVLSAVELEELIGPIALYPDDLLAIILPASTFPLQIVQAARFLEELEDDSSLKPDEDWDDSVVALTNYPEVVELMSDDLDWTWQLGEAVVAQQTDVIKAIEAFRDRAYAAGNLKSDDFQNVTEKDGTIQITPVEEDVIYVPYYEPERVVVYQPRPVYYYYPRPYPVYYYPYPAGYAFSYPYFWGVTTAFSIAWHTHYLNVWHHSYWGHPYYGRRYWNHWWYRRPNIHVHNNYYSHHNRYRDYDRHRHGDYWGPNTRRTVRSTDQRITRTRYYPGSRTDANTGSAAILRSDRNRVARSSGSVRPSATRNENEREARSPVTFRERTGTATSRRTDTSQRASTVRPSVRQRETAGTPRATRQPSRNPVTARPSIQRQQEGSSSNRRAIARPSDRTGSNSRPPELRRSYSAPSRSRPSVSAPPPSRQTYTRPPQSRQNISRPSQSRQSASRPPQSRQSISRPSQSRPSYSKPSRSKPSQAKSNQSGKKHSSDRSSRSSSRSGESRRR